MGAVVALGQVTTASHTKTGELREIPISARLRAALEMAGLDPAGRAHGSEAYVFGNEVSERAPFPRKAWETARLKAHGFTPQWQPGKGKLTAASRAQLVAINLHFHDLRHEGAHGCSKPGGRCITSATCWGGMRTFRRRAATSTRNGTACANPCDDRTKREKSAQRLHIGPRIRPSRRNTTWSQMTRNRW